jgi:hypothetical protein
VVVNQVNKDWDYTKDNMDACCAKVRKLEKHVQGLEILHVLHDSNVAANILAKLWIIQGEGPTWCVCRGVVSSLYQTT